MVNKLNVQRYDIKIGANIFPPVKKCQICGDRNSEEKEGDLYGYFH